MTDQYQNLDSTIQSDVLKDCFDIGLSMKKKINYKKWVLDIFLWYLIKTSDYSS
jgi:hypothetical protein